MNYRYFIRCLLAIFLTSASVVFCGEAPWPGWLGPQRNGIVAMPFQMPQQWPKKLIEIWGTDIGPGYSSPIFDGKTIFLQFRRDTQEVLAAFDVSKGQIVWE